MHTCAQSLDVEGGEEMALLSLPLDRYTVRCLTVETTTPAMLSRLAQYNYIELTEGGLLKRGDRLFVHASVPGGVEAAREHSRHADELWNSNTTSPSAATTAVPHPRRVGQATLQRRPH